MRKKNRIVFFFLLVFTSIAYAVETMPHEGLFTIKTVKGTDERGQFSLQYPVLTSGFKSGKYKKINATLKKAFLDDQFCMKDAAKHTSMQSLSSIKVTYISHQLISLVAKYDTYCGGPYPEHGETYSTYDVNAGVKIDLLTQVKDADIFKSFLAKEFKNHMPQKAPQGCHDLYSTEELLQVTPQFIVTAGALVIKADYIHAAKSCEFDIAIQHCTLNQFLKSDSVLFAPCFKA